MARGSGQFGRQFGSNREVAVRARPLLWSRDMLSRAGSIGRILPLTLWFSGCLPFAVPPSRIESGVGTRFYERDPATGVIAPKSAGVLRGAIHPTQVLGAPAERLFDVGLGYRGEWRLSEPGPALHGPYAELGLYPLRAPLGRRTRLRWGSYASADVVLADQRAPGVGATLGTLLELSGESAGGSFSHVDEDSAVFGAAQGQWAVGLFANTALREVNDDFSQSVVTGMSLRLPFVVGVACCAWPRFGEREERHGVSKSASSRSKKSRKSEAPIRREHRAARPRRKP